MKRPSIEDILNNESIEEFLRTKYRTLKDQFDAMAHKCMEHDAIAFELYEQYDVKRGLRDKDGKGVLAGLTRVSDIQRVKLVDGVETPCPGELLYRGVNVKTLVADRLNGGGYAFERATYILLNGALPTDGELEEFCALLGDFRRLPMNFFRDVIMKAACGDMMNMLTRCVLTLFPYDQRANETSLQNVLRQCIWLLSAMPLFAVYSYQAYGFYAGLNSLVIHKPNHKLSTAENLLYMLRPDSKYTPLEATVLDVALVLHADHGGGNNSTFTTRVVTSTGTDTYSAVAAALCSLKGPKHGGANLKVTQMLEDIKENVRDWSDTEQIWDYLDKLAGGDAFDGSGLIYGLGHAVYTLSDPREEIFKELVAQLAEEKGLGEEFALYDRVETIGGQVLAARRGLLRPPCANVDFYSGFAYRMLGIPMELFTPIFAISRMAGWAAHRIEELINGRKIIRPAYKFIAP